MKVQKLVAWEVNRLQKTAHLTHRVPSQGGRRPDGQQSLPYRLEDTNRTGPVYTHRGGGAGVGPKGRFLDETCI